MCERLEDYGNSLTLARAPGLWGGWAERMHLLPGSTLFRVPDEVPDEVAVLTEPMAVTHGLDEVMRGGETVVVLGCGPLGICHVLKAVLLGAERVFVTDLHPPRLALAEAIGRRGPRPGVRWPMRPTDAAPTSSSTAPASRRRSRRRSRWRASAARWSSRARSSTSARARSTRT